MKNILNKTINRVYKALVLSTLIGLVACNSWLDTGYQEIEGQWYWVVQRGLLPDLVKTELNVDNASFQVLNQHGYAKDNKQAFFRSQPVEGADALTFELLSHNKREVFAVDKNQAYVIGLPIHGSDPDSFEVFKLNYARDKSHIFCGTFKLENANPSEFQVLEVNELWITTHDQPTIAELYGEESARGTPVLDCFGWARDGQSYYYGARRLEGVDYETFERLGNWSRDKSSYYFGARRVRGIDYDTFEILDDFTAKDKHGLFHSSRGEGNERE